MAGGGFLALLVLALCSGAALGRFGVGPGVCDAFHGASDLEQESLEVDLHTGAVSCNATFCTANDFLVDPKGKTSGCFTLSSPAGWAWDNTTPAAYRIADFSKVSLL